MAVGHYQFPVMPEIAGITLGTTCAGFKQTVRDDLLVIAAVQGGSCAAVFTQNAFCAAPVHVGKAHLAHAPRWLLVNSGNANAGTGAQGLADTLSSCRALAALVEGEAEQVLPFSTGVIGQPLPMDKLTHALPQAVDALAAHQWQQAAIAIMTTDTFAKGVTHSVLLAEGQRITLNGIAKGAGMIHPNMATLLSFIATNARISAELLQRCLRDAVELSFNRITVDGDTSTNDACVLIASGASDAPEIMAESDNYQRFAAGVSHVCQALAELIVRDGEGATKLIRIVVSTAADDAEAVQVAKTIAHSPLVKTAFFASDANWGRILAAVGRAGLNDLQLDVVEIYLNEVCIVRHGGRAADYTEAAGQAVMQGDDITITVKLARGVASQTVLTCDFSYDYIKINAEYRT